LAKFFNGREVRKAEELRGPRIYSTDLLPSHFDPSQPDDSVEVAARALKVKIITKGIVTLNSAYLVSPLGVLLMDKHTDLFAGGGILPAFRVDKDDLSDLIASNEGFEHAGIKPARIEEHLSRLGDSIKTVMPWELADTAERFRSLLLSGLNVSNSYIATELAIRGLKPADVEKIVGDVTSLDLSNSTTLRAYIDELAEGAREPMGQFAATCYHLVGTGVVNCEAGTDLSPLSAFRAADSMLAGRGSSAEQLSETTLFLEAFMASALDAIQSMAAPSQIIDTLDFKTAHQLGEALRESGFQDKYDGVIRDYRNSAGLEDDEEALRAIDPERIAAVAIDLADHFEKHVLTELASYQPKIVDDAKARLVEVGGDILKDVGQATPGVGNVIALAEAGRNLGRLGTAYKEAREFRKSDAAFAAAKIRRFEAIQSAIKNLKTNDARKNAFLNAVALLADVHGIQIQRG